MWKCCIYHVVPQIPVLAVNLVTHAELMQGENIDKHCLCFRPLGEAVKSRRVLVHVAGTLLTELSF